MRPRAPLAFTLLAVLLAAPAAHAVPLAVETWELGYAGWTLTGSAQRECRGEGATGLCNLLIVPPCCGRYDAASRAFHPPATGNEVSMSFRPSSHLGDTDAYLVASLAGGGRVEVVLTDGIIPNNGVTIRSYDGAGRLIDLDSRFASWPAGARWYRVAIALDPLTLTAHATLGDALGVPMGISDPVRVVWDGRGVTGISLPAVSWSDQTKPFRFDDVGVGVGVGTP